MNPFLYVLALGVHAPNARVTMHNATEALVTGIEEVFEVRVERGPAWVCNSSDHSSCSWQQDGLILYY